jgi:HPt (histidine-containing phosphotransfer) domain-containing protein
MLDKSAALEVFKVTEDVLDGIIREFLVLAAKDLGAIRDGLESQAWTDVGHRVHSFKGMAGNLRLDLCHRRAMELEKALASEDPSGLSTALLRLEEAVEEVREAMGGQCSGLGTRRA